MDGYFTRTGFARRDLPAMYAKAALILGFWASAWALLTFWSTSWRSAVPLTFLLGVGIAWIGMGVMHDANHNAFSKHLWVNRLFGWTNDLMGASALIWRTKHNVVHHTYTNIEGVDDDLDVGPLARLSPAQEWRPAHRFQHIYMWGLYAMLLVKWVFYDDFNVFRAGRVGRMAIPKPSTSDMSLMWLGKVAYICWNIIIPLKMHSATFVLGTWLGSSVVASLILSLTFQLAHCVEEADVVASPPGTVTTGGQLPMRFTEHQIATTVDFGRESRLLTFFVGGLNFQTVHHLAPRVCHLHYRALSKEFEAFCLEHGLTYRVHPSLGSAVRSHFRILRSLGQGAPQNHTAGEGQPEPHSEPPLTCVAPAM